VIQDFPERKVPKAWLVQKETMDYRDFQGIWVQLGTQGQVGNQEFKVVQVWSARAGFKVSPVCLVQMV
jgi:hypothetical protein